MTQEYTPVDWVDETPGQPGTVINKARLDQMQTAHHYADGFEEVDVIPTADPQVDYHKVVFCTLDNNFYQWNGSAWIKITGPGEVISAGDMVVKYLGNGSATEFDVVHNLGTTKLIYSMQKGSQFVNADVSVVDADTIHVSFKTAPALHEITMSIYSGGMVPVADQYVHEQTVASATWNITHDRHRRVQVQVQDTAGTVIIGKVTQPTLDTVVIEFNAATAGTAIIE